MAPYSSTSISAPETPLIELRDVSCGYGDRVILERVNLRIPRGKVLALIGTSGGGKTTVLRLLGRQIKPISGQVLFDGVDLAGLNLDELYAVRRRMGMLFQLAPCSPTSRCSRTWPSRCASTPACPRP